MRSLFPLCVLGVLLFQLQRIGPLGGHPARIKVPPGRRETYFPPSRLAHCRSSIMNREASGLWK